MIKHIYGFPLEVDIKAGNPAMEEALHFLLNLFIISDEYHIESMGQPVAQRITNALHHCNRNWTVAATDKAMFQIITSKTAELYNTLKLTDQSLLENVLEICVDRLGFGHMDKRFGISEVLEGFDIFGGRLLRLFFDEASLRMKTV